jgi:glycosyltransferase involved in cell wall biosynthesis
MKQEIVPRGSSSESNLRIAYVCTDTGVPVFGSKGASVHVQEVLSTFLRLGAAVKLFASTTGGERVQGLESVEVCEMPNWPRGKKGDKRPSVESANKMLHSFLEQKGPFDIVYERYSLWSYGAMEYAKSVGLPGLLEVNAPLIEEEATYRHLQDRPGAEQVARRVFDAARLLFAVSSGVVNYLAHFPETKGKVHLIANGVNPSRFPANTTPSRPAQPGIFTIGFVGSLKPWHGLGTLADAFSIIRKKSQNVRLLIVGDGPEKENLVKDLRGRNLLSLTEFTGKVTPFEIPGMLTSMDIGVAPYPNLKGFYFSPLKVYEYMAAGLPVVASSTGDISELIHDGVDGFLVPPGDPVALATVLDRLRSDQDLRTRIGATARASVVRSHTWDKIVREFLDLSGITVSHKLRDVEVM